MTQNEAEVRASARKNRLARVGRWTPAEKKASTPGGDGAWAARKGVSVRHSGGRADDFLLA